jgi:hypothetical protein
MIRNIGVIALILAAIVASPAAELKEARVTEVVKDVKLLPTGAAPRPAAVSDEVRDGTAVRTGMESRSELKFPDQTLARLGSNTTFSFSEGTRSLNLQDGAMLLRVPKGAGGAKISSSAVTAAITGTTVMLETHPLTQKRKDSYYKFIVLEGTARLFLPGKLGESVLVKAGQMIIMPLGGGAKKIPEAVDVDIQTIMQSSLLITGFGPLGSEQLIAFEQTKQSEQKASGQLHETNLVIAGGGTNVILGDPNTTDVAVTAAKTEGIGPFSSPTPPPTPTPTPTPPPTPTPTPTPTPGKFGTPVPITSPVPYVITSGTTITTDPSITTNGVTDDGKIYRGAATDGPASAWAFGSTSTFDTSSGFDEQIVGSGAAFKFTALQLAGNPTISTANGEINLGLIAVNGITSGSPGGLLTFSGIRGLLLATQNGSIDLGPEISFSGLHDITLYARGVGSVLTLASDISTTSLIRLYGEGVIQVTGNLTTQTLTAAAGANINIGGIGSTTINASEASLLIPNSGSGNIPGAATITLLPAGNLALNGPNGLSLTIDNTNGGHIGQDADIFLSTADLNAGSLNVLVNNRNGGSIGAASQIACSISGNLTTQGDATIGITNRNDGLGGGTIVSNATVAVNANSISVGGSLQGFVSTNGGQIGNLALLQFTAAAGIHSVGDMFFHLQAVPFNGGGGTLTPSSIGSEALLSINAASITTNGFLGADLNTNGGGHIKGNALLMLNASGGDINAQGGIAAQIPDTGFGSNGQFATGGQIDGSAVVVLNGQNIITASTATGTPGTDTLALEASIYSNAGGKVGKDAIVGVVATQNISAPGTAFFAVANGNYQNLGPGTIGGMAQVAISASSILTGDFLPQIYNYGGASIGGNAEITVDATNLTVNGTLNSYIDNSQSGTIGGDAKIDFSVSGNTSVSTDATFEILGSDGANTAAININGGNYSVGGTFLGSIDGNGTFTLNNVTIAADTLKVGVFGSNGTLRIGGGTLSANTLLHLYAPASNGMIDFVANTTLNSSGTAVVIAANTVTIENGVVVTIGGSTPANVFVSARNANYSGNGGNNSTTGTFAGAGATTQPLGGQPPFDSPSARLAAKQIQSVRTGGGGGGRTIHITDSSQLGALLENASPGRDGKVRVASAAIPRAASAGNAPVRTSRTSDRHRPVDTNVGSKILASRLP